MMVIRAVAVALLGAAVGAVELGKTTYNLNMIVERGEYERTLADAEALLAVAKAEAMGTAVQLMLRSGADKIRKSFGELEARRAKEATAAARVAEKAAAEPYRAPASLTNASVGVRPLKAYRAPKKKSNLIRRVTRGEFDAMEAAGTLMEALGKPLILEGGVADLDGLRERFSAARLMEDPAYRDVRVEYVTPAVARSRRTFEQAQENVEYDHTVIDLERYFVNCFNLRAKPDFRKRGGGQTDHCEQDLSYAVVAGADDAGLMDGALAGLAGAGFAFDRGRTALLLAAASRGVDAREALEASTTRIVLGPAGSGDHLRSSRAPFVDGLVHGERRWFTMGPAAFDALRDKAEAAEALEPASAFTFFEAQFEELVEDLGLGSARLRYAEGSQRPGDVLFAPPDTIYTSLAYEDAVSVRGLTAGAHEAAYTVDARLWAPELGGVPDNFAAAACYGDGERLFDVEAAKAAAGPGEAGGRDAQMLAIAAAVLPQIFPTARDRDAVALAALADCAGYRAVAGTLAGSQCAAHAANCARALKLEKEDWLAPLLGK